MTIYETLDAIPLIKQPIVLSIGNFDGVHKGHQALIERMHDLAKQERATKAILTFKNHPSEILKPYQKTSLLTDFTHKTSLLHQAGIDHVIMLMFDQNFANQTAEEFLHRLKEVLPFRHLILGYDAKLGKERQGDKKEIERMGRLLSFTVEIIPPVLLNDTPISSTEIRKALQADDLKAAKQMLGRKYSILSKVISGKGYGETLGFPTANCDVEGLALPSFGVYAVTVLYENQQWKGIANLGFAPTVQSRHKPLLEVHLLDQNASLNGKTIEVVFEEFIRPEIHFESVDKLKQQIRQDIESARSILIG